MPRCTNTYAIRPAVEGGSRAKTEPISAGQSGEQSLKRIESAGEHASGAQEPLPQAELLRTGSARSVARSPASPQSAALPALGDFCQTSPTAAVRMRSIGRPRH